MVIFIDDKPIRVINHKKLTLDYSSTDFDVVVDARLDILKLNDFFGHIVILNADATTADKIFTVIKENPAAINFLSISLVTETEETIEDAIKKHYTVIKAAGGVVVKNNKVLLISRLMKWDLPKGKLESGEKSQIAAIREIEEETGVKAKLVIKICVTWHTYTHNGQNIIKRTKWYLMDNIDDSKMKPQKEEGITEIKWADKMELMQAMTNSYSSIRYVIDSYRRLIRNSLVYGN
jgi:8-oxo-dGTP pyrophosphatase MutT (NUDIX family)